MITSAITKAYKQLEARNWDHIYFAIDIHDTIAESTYNSLPTKLYDFAVEPLQTISHLPEVKIILYTSCHERDFSHYSELLWNNDVEVAFINCNPDVKNTEFGCFDRKFYYNIIADDKAGFNPMLWPLVRNDFLAARRNNRRILELYG